MLCIVFGNTGMSSKATHTARLNFRLPAHLKAIIEKAATQAGQSLSAFAISTLVTSARVVLPESSARRIFEITTLDRVLPIAPSRRDALRDLVDP